MRSAAHLTIAINATTETFPRKSRQPGKNSWTTSASPNRGTEENA